MKNRTLPGTGIGVSNLALGTMGSGTETAEVNAFSILTGSGRPREVPPT